MIGRLLRLAVATAIGAWLIERWLARQAGPEPPAPIRTVVTVAAPIERVWATLADIEGQPRWMRDLVDVEVSTPGPVGVGTRAEGRVEALGITVPDPIEVTAFEPPSHFALRHLGLVTGTGDIRLTSGPDGSTTVTWDEVLVPPLLPRLGGRLLALAFEPIFRRDLENLARLVEAG